MGELPSVLVKFSVAFADRCLRSPFPAQAVTFTPCPAVLLPPSCCSFLQGYPAVSHGALATDRFVFLHVLSSSEQDMASAPSRVVPSSHPSFSPPVPNLRHVPYQANDGGQPGTSGKAGAAADALSTVTVPRQGLELKKNIYHPYICYICVLHCVYSPQVFWQNKVNCKNIC